MSGSSAVLVRPKQLEGTLNAEGTSPTGQWTHFPLYCPLGVLVGTTLDKSQAQPLGDDMDATLASTGTGLARTVHLAP